MRAIGDWGRGVLPEIPLKINPHSPSMPVQPPRADWEPALQAIGQWGYAVLPEIALKINPHLPLCHEGLSRADWGGLGRIGSPPCGRCKRQ